MANTTTLNGSRVWFITGCSTGFGRALASAVLARGDRLVTTARKIEQVQELVEQYPQQARAVRLDVTDPNKVRAAVSEAVQAFGRIDVLVNNAGYGVLGAIEEVEDVQVRRQFETNLFGALDVMRAVLPHMRQQRSGHILNISSVGGFTGFAGFGIYNATKFALEGLSEALALEVAPLGIHVTIVEPGSFRTDWAGRSLATAPHVIEDYAESSGKTRQFIIQEENGQQLGDPKRAAEAMIAAVEAPKPPLRLVLGADALERIRNKLSAMSEELKVWEKTTVETALKSEQAAVSYTA